MNTPEPANPLKNELIAFIICRVDLILIFNRGYKLCYADFRILQFEFDLIINKIIKFEK